MNYEKIPESTIQTIKDYLEKGWEPGDFVRAVLENNLKMAFACADRWNTAAMKDIVCYVYNEIPHHSHGNREIVDNFIKRIKENDEKEE